MIEEGNEMKDSSLLIPRIKSIIGLNLDHASQVNIRMQEWLDEIKIMRKKSLNLKGTISGRIRVLVEALRKEANLQTIKTSSKNDPETLEMFWKASTRNLKKKNWNYEIDYVD
jgi:hypothetical protein